MANGTGIEWTDATWNPVTGCDNCYAAHFVAPDNRPTGEHCVQRLIPLGSGASIC